MKKRNILLLLVFVGLITTIVSLTMESTKIIGPHGGRVISVDEYNIETKITSNHVYGYLLNKKYKPVSNKGITCEMKFFYHEGGSLYLYLKPYQEDGFISDADVIGYHSFRATFHVFGKPVSATFNNENEDLIVEKE